MADGLDFIDLEGEGFLMTDDMIAYRKSFSQADGHGLMEDKSPNE